MGELSKSSLSSNFSLSDYSSINSRFSYSDISLSASTSIPDLSSSSSCPSSNLSLDLKSRFSSESSRRTSSSHTIYWSKSSTLSTITVPFTRAPEKPPRRKQTTEEEEEEHKHVICIKINQEPDTELDCANVQDVGQLSPVPLSPSPPPPPVSLTWSSLHSHANDEELPPPPQLTDFDKELSKAEASAPIQPEHSSWVRHIQFAVPAQVREDDDLGTASLCYEEEHEAFNEIAEYISNSLNRKLVFKGNCGENHHLLTKLDNLKTRQRNDFLMNLKRKSFK